MKVPASLLNRTLRFLVLRFIWISAVVNIGATFYYLRCPGSTSSIAQHVLLVSTPMFIAFHHILDAFLGVPWLIELVLETAEIAFIAFILKKNYTIAVSWRHQPTDFWLRIFTYWILIVSLFILIVIRVAWLCEGWSRGARLLSRMDVRTKGYEGRSTTRSSSNVDLEKSEEENRSQSLLALATGALAGRSIWRKKMPGEPRALAISRGALFVVCLAILLGFMFAVAVMSPIKELAMTPSKMLVMKAIPWGMPPLTEDNKWVVRVKQPSTKNNMMYSPADAVKVYPLWEPPSQPAPTNTDPSNGGSAPATLERRQAYSTMPMPSQVGEPSSAPVPRPTSTTSTATQSKITATGTTESIATPTPTTSGAALALPASAPPCLVVSSKLDSVIYECPARQQIPKESLLNALDADVPSLLDQAFPDLLVVVDFAALYKSIERPLTDISQISVRHHSVHVALALTTNVDEINEFIPVTLVPGLNLLGITDLIMRQRSTQPALSTIGWPDLFNTSMAAELAYVVNDPHAGLLDLPLGPNIATLRFSARNKATAWRVKQDAREKSVLSGLSAVGGLGSLLGTLFLFLFGSSLLGIMFGIKSLSPFGLFHNLCDSRVAAGSQEHDTALQDNMVKINDERGVMKYLFDMFIDVDLIAKYLINQDPNEHPPSPPSREGDVNETVESDDDAEGGAGLGRRESVTQPLMN